MAYGVVSVANTATLIVAANNKRRHLVLNNQGTATVYIGPDTSISTANTVSLQASTVMTQDDRWHRGAIYGIVASGTVSVAYWEVEG